MADVQVDEPDSPGHQGKGPESDERNSQIETARHEQTLNAQQSLTEPSSSSDRPTDDPIDEESPAPPLPPRPSRNSRNPQDREAAPSSSEAQQHDSSQRSRRPTAKELARQPYTHELRLLPPYNKTYSRIKLWLAMLLFAWGAATLAISPIYLSEILKSIESPATVDWVGYFGIPYGAVDMIWNVAEVLTHCARGGDSIYPRGIHPGAHVGVHLVMWMVACVGIGFGSNAIVIFQEAAKKCNSNQEIDKFWFEVQYTTSCDDFRRTGFMMQYAAALLAAFSVTVLIHFTLFVWACVDTYHRNRLSLGGLLATPSMQGAASGSTMPSNDLAMQQMEGGGLQPEEVSREAPVVEEKVLQHTDDQRMQLRGQPVASHDGGSQRDGTDQAV